MAGPGLTALQFRHSPQLVQILQHLRLSLLISTYQAGRVLLLGTHAGQLTISSLACQRPMGIAAGSHSLAIGTGSEIRFLAAQPGVVPGLQPPGHFDRCFVPQTSKYTGNILGHDLAWGSAGLWVVNTLFSCLCTLDDRHSFVPQWTPPFITQIADEDRCHLNGLAMENGKPAYVTALAQTDTPAGWRADRIRTGCLIRVSDSSVIATDLCMPHSPRMHAKQLYLLNSGHGALCRVDLQSGVLEQVATVPGYTRGLALHDRFAFVGLSKIRESNVFGGLPIARQSLHCGLAVIDLISQQTVAHLEFLNTIDEIFAVECLPDCLNAAVGGAELQGDTREIWIVPQAASTLPLRL
jgi:uncharacterized protein (TIGR03032 family)